MFFVKWQSKGLARLCCKVVLLALKTHRLCPIDISVDVIAVTYFGDLRRLSLFSLFPKQPARTTIIMGIGFGD